MTIATEHYVIRNNVVPPELGAKFPGAPESVRTSGKFFDHMLLPPIEIDRLDVLLVPDLQDLYESVSESSVASFNTCHGLYAARDHPCVSTEGWSKVLRAVKQRYGLAPDQVMILPLAPQVSTFMHEAVHHAFHVITPATRHYLLDAAVQSFAHVDEMLKGVNLEAYLFSWPEDLWAKSRQIEREGGDSTGLFHLGLLPRTEQLQCLDEYIATLLTPSKDNKRETMCLPQTMEDALQAVGYNVNKVV
jgi:hypothetical protein